MGMGGVFNQHAKEQARQAAAAAARKKEQERIAGLGGPFRGTFNTASASTRPDGTRSRMRSRRGGLSSLLSGDSGFRRRTSTLG